MSECSIYFPPGVLWHLVFKTILSVSFFVYGVRQCSNLIVLRVAVRFSQHLLSDCFSPLYSLVSFVTGWLTIGVWVYLRLSILFHWSVCLFWCQYYTTFITVQYTLKFGRIIPSTLDTLLRISLPIWGLLWFSIFHRPRTNKFKICLEYKRPPNRQKNLEEEEQS